MIVFFFRKTLVVHVSSSEPREAAQSKYYVPITLKKVFSS